MAKQKKQTKDTKGTKKAPAVQGLSFTQGKNIKSTMLRVDLEFAEYVRAQAKASGVTGTEITRSIFEAIS